jgi:iron complex outermembrane receptor protein
MNPTPRPVAAADFLSRLTLHFALALVLALTTRAAESNAPAAVGSLEGRVANAQSGEFLARARVVIEPSGQEAFTDSGGYFLLGRVPAGPITIQVFYTGLPLHASTRQIAAGQRLHLDIALGDSAATPASGAIRLDRFTVSSSKEMEGAALAINEQRFASNMRTVVATDELGFVPEGNVAEFMKFLPGITIESSGGFAREVSINGVASSYVPITVDGFNLASAHPGGGTGRNAALDMISINNLARVEVSFSPTPDMPGAALAGSVNMVPRSSFERTKPLFTASAYVLMRDNARDFHRTPGPRAEPTRKVHPGFDFTYIRPVNSRFGFTLAAGTSKNYLNQDLIQNTWRGAGNATNGVAFPHTSPDRPYLTTVQLADNTKDSVRHSFSLTVDYRLTAADRLAFSFQYTSTSFANMARSLIFNVNRVNPGDFTPFSTRGATGAGSLQNTNIGQTRDNRTYMPTLTWRHEGPLWKLDAGLGHSHARSVLRGFDRGFFNTTSAQRTGVTVSFADIFYLRPNLITVTDGTTGQPVNPYALGTYALGSTAGNTTKNVDLQRTAFANARRDFDWSVPVTLRTGLDVRQSARDLRGHNQPFTFVGRDGRTSTTPAAGDDTAAPFLDAPFSQRYAPYGFPQVQWMSNEQIWDYYHANRTHFVADENAAYRSQISGSKHIEEVVSSAYLRGDVNLLARRLKLVGGLRVEQTNASGEGPLTDPTRNFQRDARGAFILGANGRPLPITANALAVSQLTFLDRGAQAEKEYLRLFPSLNASYQVREDLIARASHYYSVGRPDLNQYASGITLPDTESAPGLTNRITVNNAGIKAWSAQTTNLRLEYYFAGVGQISAGVFRRDFDNFFGNSVFPATPEFLALYGLDPATYRNYEVSTQTNLEETVRMEGVDFSYKQALTFLPPWARGVQVFANGSAQRTKGDTRGNFAGYIPRSGSWGVSLTRPAYNLRINWSYRSRQRRNLVTATTGIEPETYNWGVKRLTIDLLGEYYFTRRLALFANLRNVNDATEDFELYGPNTPPHAQFRSRLDFGSLWTFGVKGTF